MIPFGWGLADKRAEFPGNMEMLPEAKAEIERMGPNPAVLGPIDRTPAAGRCLPASNPA